MVRGDGPPRRDRSDTATGPGGVRGGREEKEEDAVSASPAEGDGEEDEGPPDRHDRNDPDYLLFILNISISAQVKRFIGKAIPLNLIFFLSVATSRMDNKLSYVARKLQGPY